MLVLLWSLVLGATKKAAARKAGTQSLGAAMKPLEKKPETSKVKEMVNKHFSKPTAGDMNSFTGKIPRKQKQLATLPAPEPEEDLEQRTEFPDETNPAAADAPQQSGPVNSSTLNSEAADQPAKSESQKSQTVPPARSKQEPAEEEQPKETPPQEKEQQQTQNAASDAQAKTVQKAPAKQPREVLPGDKPSIQKVINKPAPADPPKQCTGDDCFERAAEEELEVNGLYAEEEFLPETAEQDEAEPTDLQDVDEDEIEEFVGVEDDSVEEELQPKKKQLPRQANQAQKKLPPPEQQPAKEQSKQKPSNAAKQSKPKEETNPLLPKLVITSDEDKKPAAVPVTEIEESSVTAKQQVKTSAKESEKKQSGKKRSSEKSEAADEAEQPEESEEARAPKSKARVTKSKGKAKEGQKGIAAKRQQLKEQKALEDKIRLITLIVIIVVSLVVFSIALIVIFKSVASLKKLNKLESDVKRVKQASKKVDGDLVDASVERKKQSLETSQINTVAEPNLECDV